LRLLVTGGAGFIGSNFVRYILKEHPEDKVINLDKLTYAANLEILKEFEKNPSYQFVKGDIGDEELLNDLLEGVDVVLNFAAESHVDRSIVDPDEFIRTNVWGTNVLLRVSKEKKVGRFVQISTDEVYGSIEKGSFSEESLLNPSSPYSASKAAADLLALAYFKTYNFPVLITRSTNNFGPFQHREKFIPTMIYSALNDKPLPIYGNGQNIRDWIYVEDNCRAIDLVLRKGKEGEIYNIGAGNEKTNLEVAREILKILGKSESLISFVPDRLGHDFRYSVTTEKIKNLGFRLKWNFYQGLKETIDWYQNFGFKSK